MRRVGLLALLLTVAGIVAPAHSEWQNSPDAAQLIYQNGVPHTDANGRPMMQYDAARSFLPIGIYHALHRDTSAEDGMVYRFSDLTKAGFNVGWMWWGNPPLETAKAAEAAGLQIVLWGREREAEMLRELAKSPALLGYTMDDEPINHLGPGLEKRFEEIKADAAKIRAVDKTHPIFFVDSGWILPPARDWWIKLNTWGDISSHDSYPINGRNTSLSMEQGIPQTVSLAVSSNDQQKPVWFVVQNHEWPNPNYGLIFPTIAQQRCMVYTALIHGATGIIHFALDSFVTRDAKVVGISPDPKPKYYLGTTATASQLRQSRDLWHATAALNAELETLKPSLLSPTADVPYEVALDDAWKPVTETPIRTLLKTNPAGGYTLLMANVDAAQQKVRVRFPGKNFKATQIFDAENAGEFAREGDAFQVLCQAYDIRVFHIEMLP
jgi:hypothetical protein